MKTIDELLHMKNLTKNKEVRNYDSYKNEIYYFDGINYERWKEYDNQNKITRTLERVGNLWYLNNEFIESDKND